MKQAVIESSGAANLADGRLIVVRTANAQLTKVWPETGGSEQVHAGPTHVVVGKEPTDEQCISLARRFFRGDSNVDVDGLIAFRDSTTAEACQ